MSQSQEVVRQNPADVVAKYQQSFTRLLPSHMRDDGGGDQWVATVKSLLVTRPEIAEAASNDVGAFLGALVQAARKGLEPGTKEFHLVPFAPKKGQPRIIQGIEGYQGIIERIYRAGAVSSVIVEVVKSKDEFEYLPGGERPRHVVDWFGDRGDLIGAYAYAIMRDGSTSKVVIVGPAEIRQAQSKSASAASPYSPWNTNPDAMWAKTAARKLENWVPTSAEFRRQQLRDAQAVLEERSRSAAIAQHLDDLPIPATYHSSEDADIDPVTGEVLPDVVDAEIVEDEPVAPMPAGGETGEAQPAPRADEVSPPAPAEERRPSAATRSQRTQIREQATRLGIQANPAEKLMWLELITGRTGLDDPTGSELTAAEGERVLAVLTAMSGHAELEAWGAGQQSLTES